MIAVRLLSSIYSAGGYRGSILWNRYAQLYEVYWIGKFGFTESHARMLCYLHAMTKWCPMESSVIDPMTKLVTKSKIDQNVTWNHYLNKLLSTFRVLNGEHQYHWVLRYCALKICYHDFAIFRNKLTRNFCNYSFHITSCLHFQYCKFELYMLIFV